MKGAVFLLLVVLVVVGSAKNLQIKVPNTVTFVGDKVKSLCSAPISTFDNKFEWSFELENGDIVPVANVEDDSDYIAEDNVESFYRRSYLQISDNRIRKIWCAGTLKAGEIERISSPIEVNAVDPVPTFEEEYGNEYDSRYWVPHKVTNSSVRLGNEVTSFKLSCIFSSEIKWSFDKLKLRTSPLRSRDCYVETLEINPISSVSARKYICSSSKDEIRSFVDITVPTDAPSPSHNRRVYDNETMEAVETIVEVFTGAGDGTVYGVGFGSSAASMLMIVGIVVLKRLLNKRRDAAASNTTV